MFKFRFNFLVLYFLDIPPENADWIRAGNGCEGYLRWPEIISASLLSRGKSVVFGHIMTLGWSLFMQISYNFPWSVSFLWKKYCEAQARVRQG